MVYGQPLKRLRLALAATLMAALVFPVQSAPETSAVTAKQIQRFKKGSDETRFGPLEFIGGIEFTSPDSRVQSLSSIRFRPDGRHFVSVLDTGEWLTGAIERDAAGRLSGLSDVSVNSILLRNGRPGSKTESDAEGFTIRGGQAIVSFEQQHRVDVYPDPGFQRRGPSSRSTFSFRAMNSGAMPAWRRWSPRRRQARSRAALSSSASAAWMTRETFWQPS